MEFCLIVMWIDYQRGKRVLSALPIAGWVPCAFLYQDSDAERLAVMSRFESEQERPGGVFI